MAQLRMKWLRETPKSFSLPDGWLYRTYESEDDIAAWTKICSQGQLGVTDGDAGAYERAIGGEAAHGLLPERDLFFVCDDKFMPVATVAAFVNCNNRDAGVGQIHMVSSLESCRGQGIGKAMMTGAVVHLFGLGCTTAQLTTDDFRVPAICSYLDNGFHPVISGSDISGEDAADFLKRWDAIFAMLGREKNYISL